MSLRDRIIQWLDLPTRAWVIKEITAARSQEWAKSPASPKHWSQPHNAPISEDEVRPLRIVPDGYPFPKLFKTDDEALSDWDDEILEKWFLTEWDRQLEKLILEKESKQQNNEQPKANRNRKSKRTRARKGR